MAEFRVAYARLMEHEGGYYDDPNGGETDKGVARKWNAEAWADGEISDEEAEAAAWERWDKLRCSEIPSQRLAEHMLDFAYMSGSDDAARTLQRAYNRLVPEGWDLLKEDGWVGPITIRQVARFIAAKEAWHDALIHAFICIRGMYYLNLNDRRHVRGWLKRIVW